MFCCLWRAVNSRCRGWPPFGAGRRQRRHCAIETGLGGQQPLRDLSGPSGSRRSNAPSGRFPERCSTAKPKRGNKRRAHEEHKPTVRPSVYGGRREPRCVAHECRVTLSSSPSIPLLPGGVLTALHADGGFLRRALRVWHRRRGRPRFPPSTTTSGRRLTVFSPRARGLARGASDLSFGFVRRPTWLETTHATRGVEWSVYSQWLRVASVKSRAGRQENAGCDR